MAINCVESRGRVTRALWDGPLDKTAKYPVKLCSSRGERITPEQLYRTGPLDVRLPISSLIKLCEVMGEPHQDVLGQIPLDSELQNNL
ncbi:hypothetical protein AVEN_166130-1 [Araneus ventricosus]|uniref:Uncharacterized protein n=1 Tax=Araneus ventricosus TaxID=182803 RepID=A0A4Y2SPW1_ARAVE|nr:hypothetical protein AVEN_166130-1 [Araneus ventricosus]